MSNHFVSINRGKDGFHPDDFTLATSSTTGDDLELRIADAPGWTRFEVVRALETLIRWYSSNAGNLGGSNFPPQ